MPNGRVDLYQVYRVAKMYYGDNLTQQEIAEQEHISRSQISRYLESARSEGIVQIHVHFPDEVPLESLPNIIKRELNLKDVRVVPIPAGIGESEAIDMVSINAALYIQKELKNCKTIGVGWGRTLYRMSCVMPPMSSVSEATFVPLIGASGTDNPSLQINAIMDHIASQFHGRNYFVNVPAFRQKTQELSPLDVSRLKKLNQLWTQMDGAVVGIANWDGVNTIDISEVSGQSDYFQGKEAAGEMLCQFFQEDGNIFTFAKEYVPTAYDIRQFSRVPKVICVAAHPSKVRAILTAARQHYFNMLVVDSVTARELCNTITRS